PDWHVLDPIRASRANLLILHATIFLFLLKPPPPRSTLFPYTTLFRSRRPDCPAPTANAGRGDDELEEAGDAGSRQAASASAAARSEEHTSELQSRFDLVCRLLLEKKKQSHQYSPTES